MVIDSKGKMFEERRKCERRKASEKGEIDENKKDIDLFLSIDNIKSLITKIKLS